MQLRELHSIASYKLGIATHLFIHIPKNAGVSIHRAPALQGRLVRPEPFFHKSRAQVRKLRAEMKAQGEHHGIQHARWRDVHPNVQRKLQAVALVRNPWARVVSRWTFAQTAINSGKIPPDYVSETFEGFLEERHVYGDKPLFWHRAVRGWYPQADYVTDETGKLRADILRVEATDRDITRYFNLDAPIPRRNKSTGPKRNYRSFYTSETIQIVADWYAADIDLFGFDFDTPATRNTVYSD